MATPTQLERPPLPGVEYARELLGYPAGKEYRIYDMASRGLIPCVRIGSRVMFDPLQLEEFIRAGGTRPGEAA